MKVNLNYFEGVAHSRSYFSVRSLSPLVPLIESTDDPARKELEREGGTPLQPLFDKWAELGSNQELLYAVGLYSTFYLPKIQVLVFSQSLPS